MSDIKIITGFTQVPNWLIDDTTGLLGTYDKQILTVLHRFCQNKDSCWPSISMIGKRAGCGKDRVHKSLNKLERIGLIQKERSGEGVSNHYTLPDLHKVVWPPVVNLSFS